jgi:hypothetical protein
MYFEHLLTTSWKVVYLWGRCDVFQSLQTTRSLFYSTPKFTPNPRTPSGNWHCKYALEARADVGHLQPHVRKKQDDLIGDKTLHSLDHETFT